ncbi:response regulator [Alsobacter soli]|uniref:Response regulator n=1 Tax=Alsobacter soli TaxID=2109933 RepID=A0A2T1HP32_9HYPH|nr:response regulator [Alsobacter soli]PSC03422.1 response regulator [Alsobacter soli]
MIDFSGLRVLVVEDELLVALALEDILNDMGCEIVGPFSQIEEAESAARSERLDAAILDVNVRGRLIYPVAELLAQRGVPVLFCSGYADTPVLPQPFRSLPQVAKPYDEIALRRAMEKAFGAVREPGAMRA